jgi:hypothetical protein
MLTDWDADDLDAYGISASAFAASLKAVEGARRAVSEGRGGFSFS